MSDGEKNPNLVPNPSDSVDEVTLEPRLVKLTTRTGVHVRRTLPHRRLRTIGAWCFIDHYGPTDHMEAMSVSAHPHAGLQTVSWLFSGEIEHRDSLGSVQKVRPGELNIMTAGVGIAHSELSMNDKKLLHGIQLWVVLPEEFRNIEPAFDHYNDLPSMTLDRLSIRLFVGDLSSHSSPAKIYSEMLGAEIELPAETQSVLPIEKNFEHGVLVVEGESLINGHRVSTGELHYLPSGSENIRLESKDGSRLILLGGLPFEEKIVMWWNFIARSHEEIVLMRKDWEDESSRFAAFSDNVGGRIPAPKLPHVRMQPRANPR